MAMASSEPSTPVSAGPSSPLGFETTPRPRKKLSFKEPETLNCLKMRKPSTRPRLIHAPNSVDLSFDENPFEEENEDLDELEVKSLFGRNISFIEQEMNEEMNIFLNDLIELSRNGRHRKLADVFL